MFDPTKAWTRRIRTNGALLAASMLLLAACSGGSTASSAPGASASAAAPSASSGATSGGGGGYGYGSGAGATASTAGGASGSGVKIVDFGFTPASTTVKVGSSLTWTNTGGVHHTVTADDGSFDSGSLAGGATFSQTFAKAGTYTYHCKIHPSMTGTVVVTP